MGPYLNIMRVWKQIPCESVKSIHGGLDQITSNAPQECEQECSAYQRVQLVCVHVPVRSTLLREEEALQKTTHCSDLVDVHLQNGERYNKSTPSGMISTFFSSFSARKQAPVLMKMCILLAAHDTFLMIRVGRILLNIRTFYIFIFCCDRFFYSHD